MLTKYEAKPSLRYNIVLGMLVLSGRNRRYLEANRDFYEKSRKKMDNIIVDVQRIFDVWTENMLMNLFSKCDDNYQAMLGWIDSLLVKSPIDCVKTAFGNKDMSDEEFLQAGAEEVGSTAQAQLMIQKLHQTLSLLRKSLSAYFINFFKEEWKREILPKLKGECDN